MDHTASFFLDLDGIEYHYPSGHWYKISCAPVDVTKERPSGFKYSLAFFDDNDTCLVRFDNAHQVNVLGKSNPVNWDHWHRFSNNTLVPYSFSSIDVLLDDFFSAIEKHLPST